MAANGLFAAVLVMALLGLGASVVEDKDNAVDKDDNDARLFFPIPNLTGTGVGTTGTNPLLPLVGGASSVYVGLTIAGLSAAVIILAILLAIAVGTDNKGGSGFFGHSGYSGSPYYGSAESSYTHYRNLQEAAKKYED